MKLYEIAADYQAFMEAIDNGDIPQEAIADTLESIGALLEEKADNIACMIKNMTAEVAAIKAEETALEERRKAKEKRVESMKAYLTDALVRSGYDKLETARNKITFRKSESVAFANEAEFIEWAAENNPELLTVKAPTVNKTAVKKALGEGVEIGGAYIEKKLNIQIK